MNNRTRGLSGMDMLHNLVGRVDDLADQLGQIKVTEDVTEDWLQIPFRFVTIAAAATAIVNRTVAGDGPFDLIEITHTAADANGTANDDFRMSIREGESVGRALTQDLEQVDANNTSGTAQRPYIIKGRRRFRSNIAILVEITNTATVANTIEVVLHGYKVFTR